MPENNKDSLFEQYGFSSEKKKSEAPDFGGFLSGTPVRVEETAPGPGVTEEYIPPADAPAETTDPTMNYMANMQNMFKSLAKDTTEAPVEEAPEEEIPDPEPELTTFLLGKNGDMPVRAVSSESESFAESRSGKFNLKSARKKKKGLQLNPELVEQSKK